MVKLAERQPPQPLHYGQMTGHTVPEKFIFYGYWNEETKSLTDFDSF